LAQPDPKVIRVQPASKVQLASKDLLDRQELKVPLALLVLPAPLVQLGPQDQQALRALPDLQDLLVPWGQWALPGHKALRDRKVCRGLPDPLDRIQDSETTPTTRSWESVEPASWVKLF
jgi:hypothetical protein